MTSVEADRQDPILHLLSAIINQDQEASDCSNDLVERAFQRTSCATYRFEALGDILASIGLFFEVAPFDDDAVQTMAENRVREWSHLMLAQLVQEKIPRQDLQDILETTRG